MVRARRVRHDRTPRRPRLSDLLVHLPVVQPAARRVRRHARRAACGFRSRSSPRCGPSGPTTSRCRSGSRPTTGWASTASLPTRRSRSRGCSRRAGADIIDVSAGQTSIDAQPVYGRMFQTPFSDRIRNEAGIATMAVGNIYEPDHVNSILMAGRADLVCLARPHLADPYWTLQGRRGVGRSRCRVAAPLSARPRTGDPTRPSEHRKRSAHDARRAPSADHRRRHRRRGRSGPRLRRRRCRCGRRRSPAATRSTPWRPPMHASSPCVGDVTDEADVRQGVRRVRAVRHRRRQCGGGRERAARQDQHRTVAADAGGEPHRACSSPSAKVCARCAAAAGAG